MVFISGSNPSNKNAKVAVKDSSGKYVNAEQKVTKRESSGGGGSSTPTPQPTYVDELGQGMSIDPSKAASPVYTDTLGQPMSVDPNKVSTSSSSSSRSSSNVIQNLITPPETPLTPYIEQSIKSNQINPEPVKEIKTIPIPEIKKFTGTEAVKISTVLTPKPTSTTSYSDSSNQGVSYDPIKSSLGSVTISDYKPTNFVKSKQQEVGSIVKANYIQSQKQTPQKPILTVEPVYKTTYKSYVDKSGYVSGTLDFLGNKGTSYLQEVQQKAIQKPTDSLFGNYGTQTIGFAAGVGSSVVGTGMFAKNLLFNPVRTSKETVTGLFSTGKRAVTTGLPEIGEMARREPGFITGFVVAEYAQPKIISKSTTLISDRIRTLGLKELPSENILAPEFPLQPYPLIKKGETAKQLLEEFKPILPGETKAAGFTASPRSFKKSTEALKGSSEFPGLYQAPRTSPKFLGLSGEESEMFNLNPFGNLKPTIARVTPTSYEIIPGVSSSETKPFYGFAKAKGSPGFEGSAVKPVSKQAKEALDFFTNKAEKGKAYVAFEKTEKEAIIPYGTKLQQTDKRFYINFEGRRVPIQEFEALPGNNIPMNTKVLSTDEVLKRTYRQGSSKSVTSSLDILKLKPMSSSSKEISSTRSSTSSFNLEPVKVSSSLKPEKEEVYSKPSSQASRKKPYVSLSSLPSRPNGSSYYEPIPPSRNSNSISLTSSFNRPSRSETDIIRDYIRSTSSYTKTSSKPIARPSRDFRKIITSISKNDRNKSKYFNNKASRQQILEAFDVLIRRKGKIETIGKNLPKGKALELGSRYSKSSTVQTFGLKRSGYTKDRDINFQVQGSIFKAPKQKKTQITDLTFTEIRGKTLTERPEVKGLLSEKKSKSRKLSIF